VLEPYTGRNITEVMAIRPGGLAVFLGPASLPFSTRNV
jgi:hypothetical protein